MQSLAAEQEYPVRPWAEDGCRAFIRSLCPRCGIHISCAVAKMLKDFTACVGHWHFQGSR